jgi:alkylhydroperoxidase family enzyme
MTPFIALLAVAGLFALWLLAARLGRRKRSAPADVGARLPLISDADAGFIARFAFRQSRRQFGVVATPLRIFAHHPKLLLGYGMLEMAQDRARRVPHRLRMLAAHKAASIIGCEFCIDISRLLGLNLGLTRAQLERLSRPGPDVFSPVELLVLELTEQMTRTPGHVSDELFANLRTHFDEAALVELVSEIALENYRARFNLTFGIAPQGFDAAACAVPSPVSATTG